MEICFPPSFEVQLELIEGIIAARDAQLEAASKLKHAMLAFSDVIDGRGTEELPEIDDIPADDDSDA